ncbi:MAG: hypothetical protein JNK65_07965 [Deltaproteobacteria bacterium]|nr:hypothetical protein [Deltaproteobacteria bacterium]
MTYHCHQCSKELLGCEKTGRGDICPFCDADLHCCKNCIHYDPKIYNECRENNAERILTKDRANFCEYFEFFQGTRAAQEQAKQSALSALEDLFKKPS